MDRAEALELLLSEALDLCVRARGLDASDRRTATLNRVSFGAEWEASGLFDLHVADYNASNPEAPISTRSATMPLWYQQQYDTDLFDWERRARAFLLGQMSADRALPTNPAPLPRAGE